MVRAAAAAGDRPLPGPCTPREAGTSLDLVRELHADVPMLGVCLGHQVIAEALGGTVVRAPLPVHGQASRIRHDGTDLFAGVASPIQVGRYHSLVVEPTSLPDVLQPTAWTDDGVLMAFHMFAFPVFGVQFHPESILTEYGYELLANFLSLAGLIEVDRPRTSAMNEICQPTARSVVLPVRPVTF